MCLLFGGCGTGLYLIWDAGDESAYESCLLSFEDKVTSILEMPELRGKIPTTNQWHTLDESEERLVLDALKKHNATFDCYRYSEISAFDAFAGESGWIEVTKLSNSTAVRAEFKGGRLRIAPKRSPR